MVELGTRSLINLSRVFKFIAVNQTLSVVISQIISDRMSLFIHCAMIENKYSNNKFSNNN